MPAVTPFAAAGAGRQPAACTGAGWPWLLLLFAIALAPAAHGHFRPNTSIRVIHLERLAEGVRLSMRLPAALAYAAHAGGEVAGGETDIPWVVSAVEGGETVHYLDSEAITRDADAFARFVAEGYRLTADGAALEGAVGGLRIHEASRQTRFTTRDEVSASFDAGPVVPLDKDLYVGDAVIDIRIIYPAVSSAAVLRLANVLPSALPADTFVANLLIGYDGEAQRISRVEGLLAEPTEIAPTRLSAVRSFLRHGFAHMLGGADHLLFVLCLAIGAASIGALLWRVTGFTIGHTLSLAAGVAGYAPRQVWGVYLIEVLIAASIIYAAAASLRRAGREYTLLVTIAIGVLHGYGFSILLAELLGRDSPHLVTSLLSFNLGIELGQVLVVLAVTAALFTLGRISAPLKREATVALASGSMLVASIWVVERSAALLSHV